MILYFDSYITDEPLLKSNVKKIDPIRSTNTNYKKVNKLQIAKYSLASYQLYPWSHVFIRYELENPSGNKEFDTYIKSLFPKAKILHRRSSSQEEYKKSLKILNRWNDPWVFFAPNNDHPIISPEKTINQYMNSLIALAEKYMKKHPYVCVMYSHFSEFLNIPITGTPENFLHGKGTKIIEENKLARIYSMPRGDFSSVQIVHKNLLEKWFGSVNLGNKRVIRAEDVRNEVAIKNQIIIAPKKEICAHFDGYLHIKGQPNEISSNKIPPLFIPQKFFEKDIKIAYGYNGNRNGWVNINPCAKKYSFQDSKHGTDLKILLEQIPFFWKVRISKIDKNPEIDNSKIKKCVDKQHAILENPWSLKVQERNIKTVKLWVRFYLYKFKITARTFLGSLRRKFQ